MTQPFDEPDVSYFFPLMQQVEQRLGHKPRFGALDAAFDAWYVHAYFRNPDDPDAFAAVPFAEKGGYKAGERHFDAEGLPLLCRRSVHAAQIHLHQSHQDCGCCRVG